MTFIENPIERTKLANDNEYPLSPAYRTEITGTGSNGVMDYSFEYPSSTPETSITLSAAALGLSQTFYFYPVSDTTVLTVDELGHSSVDFNVNNIKFSIMDAVALDLNTMLTFFVSNLGATPLSQFQLFTNNIASFAGGASKSVSVLTVSSNQASISETISISVDVGGGPITTDLVVTMTAIDAGTYVFVSGYTDSQLSQGSFGGVIHVCHWNLHPCYINSGLVGVNNGIFLALLQAMGANGFQLSSCPTIQNKLMFARYNLCGLILGGRMGANGFTDGTFDGWTFSDGTTLGITLVDGVPTVATLTLPSQSQE